MPWPAGGAHELACVVHVHSTCSDGTATPGEVVDAARAAGADAVVLTDHDTMAAKRLGCERWHGDVLMLVGDELSTNAGHLLALGLDSEVEGRGLSGRRAVAAVRAAGGLAFAAHPFSAGSRMSPRLGRPQPWRALDAGRLTGIELWSLLTDTAEAWSSPRAALRFMRRPERAIVGPPRSALASWDLLCARRQVVAIGGLDSHQTGRRLRNGRVLSPLPHERCFRWLRTHVLLDEPPARELEPDRRAIHATLAAGRCFLGVDFVGDTTGFRFWAERDGEAIEMGARAPAGDWVLRARLPAPARVTLVRDGAAVAEGEGHAFEWPAPAPGAYRVEARRHALGAERTWIISNPIYLRGGPSDAG